MYRKSRLSATAPALFLARAPGVAQPSTSLCSSASLHLLPARVKSRATVRSYIITYKQPVFPVASGGMHPGLVPELMEFMGKDVIIQAGGGIHGHPEGTRIGATAMRQAVDAVLAGLELEEYAKTHKELSEAVELWGRK